MSKKIIIRYLKAYYAKEDSFVHRFDWWDGCTQTGFFTDSQDEECIHLYFETFIIGLYTHKGDNIYNGIPLMIPNNVEGEIIEI